jgi:hypothetical protein
MSIELKTTNSVKSHGKQERRWISEKITFGIVFVQSKLYNRATHGHNTESNLKQERIKSKVLNLADLCQKKRCLLN